MSKRWPVAFGALAVTLVVLFGGYTAYQWTQVDRPLEETVARTPHVSIKEKTVSPDRILLRLETEPDFSFAEDYPPLREQMSAIAGERELVIEVMDHPDETLTQAWNEMAFGVKEGLSHQRYAAIPEAVKKATPPGVKSQVTMDETHLYVEMKRGDARLYKMLPLDTSTKEVSENG
jgi:hypothetical protein